MKIHQVYESTVIVAAGYSFRNKVLLLKFPQNWYLYARVPFNTAGNFFRSNSKGKYFNRRIRDKFPFKLLTEQQVNEWRTIP